MPYIYLPGVHINPEHMSPNAVVEHNRHGGCWACCTDCNYANHRCHFCGTELNHDSTEANGTRHWLSDCRPDLVKHEPGPLCTWSELPNAGNHPCYAYRDLITSEWTDQHVHFMTDGPMV